MKPGKNTLCSWSGGKDSCYALMQAKKNGYIPAVLLNVLNEAGKISRSHGIPAPILQLQSDAAGIPIHLIASSWQNYEQEFTEALILLKQKHAVSYAVFGDIDLQAHRDWEEKVCRNAGLEAILPLWQQNRKGLVIDMLRSGIKTMIVSCNELMGPDFIGRIIDEQCISDLEKVGVDVCGENGEFHTLVFDCPLFAFPLAIKVLQKLNHEKYWFAELALQ
ncbi:MAG: diphthine--ammonia ligase [Ferruginibacter sp.]